MKAKKMVTVFVATIGAIWLLGVTNLPRMVVVGDSLKQAKTFGAKAKIVFKVVDEEGTPVSGAKISAGLLLWSTDHNGVNGVTDRKGVLVVRGATIGDVRYSVNKDGYYYTHGGFYIPGLSGASLKDGKWQPYGMEHKVVLKRKRNPIPMYAHPKYYDYYFPELNTSYGFDLMEMDWVQPMGKGKHADLLIEYHGKEINIQEDDYREWMRLVADASETVSLTLIWTDRECGYYIVDYDGSELKSPHNAAINRPLSRSIMLNQRHNIEKCLVFRIRPRFSSSGKLIGAHYGKIYGPIGYSRTYPLDRYGKGAKAQFGIQIYANPTENDTNLEFLPYHSLNYPNERHKQPNIAP